MDKISFHPEKKTKLKKFQDNAAKTPKTEAFPLHEPEAKEENKLPEIKNYRNKNEIFTELSNRLVNRYNIDDVSVYSCLKRDNGSFKFTRIYGSEISKYVLERYSGYDCPVVCTNAEGMVDNIYHRARLIEHIGNYTVIISSSAYEVFRRENDLDSIRRIIKKAFKEAEKFR